MREEYTPKDSVPLPPPDAKVITTACDYCIVGCGYKAYVWPDGSEGGFKASENALGIDYPAPALSGRWISPNQHTYTLVDGKKHHVVVIPDEQRTDLASAKRLLDALSHVLEALLRRFAVAVHRQSHHLPAHESDRDAALPVRILLD